ncbi:uncharacterized protein LOC126994944, partial [Eriocheir sinensis]|uniref:uncharacterized protein LOC126994944 n=1 Tax=Eriocheir sinensis TaxID=95602 RepID=UPI0021C834EA
MDLTLTPQRAAIVEYGRVYIGEEMAILSLKPRPLPEYLALFRPLEVLCADSKTVEAYCSVPSFNERDSSRQLMLGVWLLVCLVLRTSYTSSLTSHLVVQGESSAINDMETLVRLHGEEGRQWGTQIFSGAFNIFLSSGSNPVYHTMKTHMQ